MTIPKADGSVEDQVAALRVGGAYYRLSLRMMKAVWRHVRLRKGFVNREAAPYGGQKLRIPRLLFMEKMRTQSRFNVRGTCDNFLSRFNVRGTCDNFLSRFNVRGTCDYFLSRFNVRGTCDYFLSRFNVCVIFKRYILSNKHRIY